MSFSDAASEGAAGPMVNMLLSYPYFDNDALNDLQRRKDVRLLVDSGAFTAWKMGRTVKLDEYCEFLTTLPVKPWRYFTLDVIGDPVASLRNYDTMLERGFHPLPIFTRGDTPAVLERYYASSDVVGIGSGVGTPRRKGFINGVMRLAGTRRVHWLGFTNMEYLKHYRPYMCDSSAWANGARYGCIRLYMGHGRTLFLDRAEFARCREQAVFDRIRAFGIEPERLARGDAWHGIWSPNWLICAASAMYLQFDLEARIGTLLFNAISSGYNLKLFLQVLDSYRSLHNARAAA
ncbi:hypothetical protein AB3X94_37335 [Paraburkholderia sp. BR10923]|uniref:hypothetical protein n=1 Tax=Paraburkholderia sp. BR10923 TaxID=3236992 RepID=UPI0034CE24F1